MRRNKGIRNETKSKFNALLKTSLQTKTKSKQQLVSDDDSIEETHFNESVDIHNEGEDLSVENKSYILDKFLNDSSHDQDPIESPKKPPVPKPRRNKPKSIPSTETYTVSPKKDIELDRIETASNHTFDVPVPGIKLGTETDDSYHSEKSKRKIKYDTETDVSYVSETKKKTDVQETENLGAVYDYSKIVNVTVHRSDRLLLDSFVVHPVVKVHLVDSESGQYVKKSDNNRSIVFYSENENIDYIGPVMTQVFNLQENRSLHPNWQESILINEDFTYFATSHNIIMFFEILDFLSTNLIKQGSQNGHLGWHKIAWAFLKPTSPTFSNIEKTVRLQLYYPGHQKKNINHNTCDIFKWWRKKKFRKYPSTLHVSVNGVPSPMAAVETFRSRGPHEVERGKPNLKLDVTKTTEDFDAVITESEGVKEDQEVVWSRKDNQICKLPNKCISKLDSCDDGCFMMSFSHSGLYLACSVTCDNVYFIIIYLVLNNEEVAKFEAHQGLIYQIIWSIDDKLLVTASADCTVCLWDIESSTFSQMLPHPSFVYSCDIHNNVIATGCFDKFIRIWLLDNNMEYELTEELPAHTGYITSLCFNRNGTMLYSADSMGAINIWKYAEEQWNLRRDVKIIDMKNTIINQILLHKKERRLLVNSRDGKIRLVDIKTSYVLQIYYGAFNSRVNTSCCFSPCGNYVLSGSENGEVHVWETETGKSVNVYNPYNLQIEIHCVKYHPKDNYLAVSHYGNNLPILLHKYEKEFDDKTTVNLSAEPSVGTASRMRSEYTRKESLNFREILQKMDHLISPK